MSDQELMAIAEQQIDWMAEQLDGSREAGRLALLSVLMHVRNCSRAPEVLEALKDLLDDYAELLGDGLTTANEPPALTTARAAIAKAEGRS